MSKAPPAILNYLGALEEGEASPDPSPPTTLEEAFLWIDQIVEQDQGLNSWPTYCQTLGRMIRDKWRLWAHDNPTPMQRLLQVEYKLTHPRDMSDFLLAEYRYWKLPSLWVYVDTVEELR